MSIGSSVTLRCTSTSDEPFLRDLYRCTREAELRAARWSPTQQQAFVEMQFNAQKQAYSMAYPEAKHQVIMLSDKPIGRLVTTETPSDFLLIDISILPEHRRRGIGKQLIRNLLNQAAEVEKGVSLHVQKTNPAKSLYERLGFVLTGEDGLYYEMRWHV